LIPLNNNFFFKNKKKMILLLLLLSFFNNEKCFISVDDSNFELLYQNLDNTTKFFNLTRQINFLDFIDNALFGNNSISTQEYASLKDCYLIDFIDNPPNANEIMFKIDDLAKSTQMIKLMNISIINDFIKLQETVNTYSKEILCNDPSLISDLNFYVKLIFRSTCSKIIYQYPINPTNPTNPTNSTNPTNQTDQSNMNNLNYMGRNNLVGPGPGLGPEVNETLVNILVDLFGVNFLSRIDKSSGGSVTNIKKKAKDIMYSYRRIFSTPVNYTNYKNLFHHFKDWVQNDDIMDRFQYTLDSIGRMIAGENLDTSSYYRKFIEEDFINNGFTGLGLNDNSMIRTSFFPFLIDAYNALGWMIDMIFCINTDVAACRPCIISDGFPSSENQCKWFTIEALPYKRPDNFSYQHPDCNEFDNLLSFVKNSWYWLIDNSILGDQWFCPIYRSLKLPDWMVYDKCNSRLPTRNKVCLFPMYKYLLIFFATTFILLFVLYVCLYTCQTSELEARIQVLEMDNAEQNEILDEHTLSLDNQTKILNNLTYDFENSKE
jgi:hypothetical protein